MPLASNMDLKYRLGTTFDPKAKVVNLGPTLCFVRSIFHFLCHVGLCSHINTSIVISEWVMNRVVNDDSLPIATNDLIDNFKTETRIVNHLA